MSSSSSGKDKKLYPN